MQKPIFSFKISRDKKPEQELSTRAFNAASVSK